jgi:hypothetical protein
VRRFSYHTPRKSLVPESSSLSTCTQSKHFVALVSGYDHIECLRLPQSHPSREVAEAHIATLPPEEDGFFYEVRD